MTPALLNPVHRCWCAFGHCWDVSCVTCTFGFPDNILTGWLGWPSRTPSRYRIDPCWRSRVEKKENELGVTNGQAGTIQVQGGNLLSGSFHGWMRLVLQ